MFWWFLNYVLELKDPTQETQGFCENTFLFSVICFEKYNIDNKGAIEIQSFFNRFRDCRSLETAAVEDLMPLTLESFGGFFLIKEIAHCS